MAILEVVLSGSYFNQQTISRWNYVSTGVPAAVSLSFALASAFGAVYDLVHVPPEYPPDTVLNSLAVILSDQWQWQQLTVLNPFSPTDFYQTPFVVPYGGLNAGEALSPVDALGFRTNQVRRDVARGTKRFPGLRETLVGTGGVLTAPALTAAQVIADAMTAVLEYDDEGNMLTFSPAVCGKEEYDPNPTAPGENHRAYRYYGFPDYDDPTEQLAHTAVSVTWQSYPQIRTQVSRQYGHGR